MAARKGKVGQNVLLQGKKIWASRGQHEETGPRKERGGLGEVNGRKVLKLLPNLTRDRLQY